MSKKFNMNKTEASNADQFFSTSGAAFSLNPTREKAIIATLTQFECSICHYPVMATWKFCPDCGGMLVWKPMTGGAHGSV
jgi:hypothetical protein